MTTESKVIFLRPQIKASERRTSDRLKYPVYERAEITVDGASYKIHNISVTGVKFIGRMDRMPEVESRVSGKIFFTHQKSIEFVGTVVRVVGDLVTINFIDPLEQNHLQEEQSRFNATHII